jgi:hypothetical protein
VEHTICEHYDINNPAADPAPARRIYGDEECRDGILEYPAGSASGGATSAPNICARLATAAAAAGGPCPPPSGPLAPNAAGPADGVIRTADALANPLARCAGCHNGGTSAPVIPSGSRSGLRAALLAPGSTLQTRILDSVSSGRMPPGTAPADGAAAATRVETYLEELRAETP